MLEHCRKNNLPRSNVCDKASRMPSPTSTEVVPKLVRVDGAISKAACLHDGEGSVCAAGIRKSATEKREVPRHVCHAISASCGELAPGPQAASLAALGRWKWVCLAEPTLAEQTKRAIIIEPRLVLCI